VTTVDRHKIQVDILVLGDMNDNTSYSATFTKTGGTGDVTVQSTAQPLRYNLVGGRIGSGGTGSCTLEVFVMGNVGGAGSASAVVTVRELGNIDGDGDVDGDDKAEMNRKLNSLSVSEPDRAFDLTGNGEVDADDKAVLNRGLNSLEIQ
jgi:hypothetical protein